MKEFESKDQSCPLIKKDGILIPVPTTVNESDLNVVVGDRGKVFGTIVSENKKICLYEKKGTSWQLVTFFPYLWISDLINLLLLTQIMRNKKMDTNIAFEKIAIDWLKEKKNCSTEEAEEYFKKFCELTFYNGTPTPNSNIKDPNYPQIGGNLIGNTIGLTRRTFESRVEPFWITDNGTNLSLGIGEARQSIYFGDFPELEDHETILKCDSCSKISILGFFFDLQAFDINSLNIPNFEHQEERELLIKYAKSSYDQVKLALSSGVLVFETIPFPTPIPFEMGKAFVDANKIKENFVYLKESPNDALRNAEIKPGFLLDLQSDVNCALRLEVLSLSTNNEPYFSKNKPVKFVWKGVFHVYYKKETTLKHIKK